MSHKSSKLIFSLLSALVALALLAQPAAAQAPLPPEPESGQIASEIFNEDFSDNSAGWTLGTEWMIGPATASSPLPPGNPDPATDTTPTADNGVAGVIIGGNATTALHGYYYLTSPAINANFPGTLTLEFYRWLNSDYTPYMQNAVEVWNGSAWVTVWQSGGSPSIFENAWSLQTYDLTPYKNAALQVRFGHTVGSSGAYIVSSWNIDDVRLFTPNTAPTANDEPYGLGEHSKMNVPAPGQLTNDSDPESDPLTAILNSGPSNGSLLFNPDGSFVYTPTLNYYGGDSFTYYAFDGQANSNIATVYLFISPLNDPPQPQNDSLISSEDATLGLSAPGVLVNDSDPENSPLTAIPGSPPIHGSLLLNLDGSFTYTPTLNYHGIDSFTYLASDGAFATPAQVTIYVSPVNDAPIANDDFGPGFATDQDTPLLLPNLQANDSDVDGGTLEIASWDTGATLGLVTTVPAWKLHSYSQLDFYLNNDDAGFSVLIQADGLAVVAGSTTVSGPRDFALARYNPDGSLDLSFSQDGMLTTDFSFYDEAFAILQQPDGKLIAVGYTNNGPNTDFALARYNTDGSLDPSFDGDGKLVSNLGGNEWGQAAFLQPDGKIVVGGYVDYGGTADFVVARYNPDGSLDLSFDSDGFTTTDLGDYDVLNALFVQPDGKIVAGGYSWNAGTSDFALARYNADGSPDTSFDGDGMLLTDFFGSNDALYGLAWLPGDQILAAGVAMNAAQDYALVRYNADGSLDTSFDGDGKLIADFGGSDFCNDLAVQPDGKILLSGHVFNAGYYNVGLARYNPDGSPDASFDGDGRAVISLNSDQYAYGLALQTDGQIIISGFTFRLANMDMLWMRIWENFNFAYDPNGQFDYLDVGEVATDTFTYELSDLTLTDSATVSVTVTGLNDAPQAGDDFYNTAEDVSLIVAASGVLSNDSDPEGSLLTASLDILPSEGDITFNPDGSFTYTPTLNDSGMVTFTYSAIDSGLGYSYATVTIAIDPANDAPVAVADAYTTTEDTPLVIAAPGLLENDSDIEGSPLTVELVSFVENGGIVIVLDGAFTYTPNPDYHGSDAFTYRVNDGQLDSNIVTVTLTVNPVNDAPQVSAGADQGVVEGALVSFSGAFVDPGMQLLEVVTTSAVAWDFGDGATANGTLTPTHTYADDGTYTVTLVVTDELGGTGTDWLLVTVDNAAPALAPLPDADIALGDPFNLTAAFSDPGLLDAHTIVIDWGDGLTETFELAPGVFSLDLAHTYAAVGSYAVTLTVTDEDGDAGSASFTANVTQTQFFMLIPVVMK